MADRVSHDPASSTTAAIGRLRKVRHRRGPRIFSVAYLVIFVISGAWSLATPAYASPDEPVQVIKAVAVAHGEFLGQVTGPNIGPHVIVSVPASFVSGLHLPSCFVGKPDAIPACSPPMSEATEPLNVSIYNGRYPSLYYGIVGIPSWFSDSLGVIYAMRLLSAALCGLFLALAITAVMLWSRSRLGMIAILLAATPQVFFLFGVVNANSLEISAAVCCWTALILLATGGDTPPPRSLVAIATAAATTEVLCRSLSPLWVCLAVATASGVAGWRRLCLLARSRSVQIGAGAVLVAAVLAVTWTVLYHATDVQAVHGAAAHAITGSYSRALLSRQNLYLQETIGRFGVLEVPAPGITYVLWELCTVAVVGLALVRARWQARMWTILVAIAGFAVPFGIVLSQASSHHGLIWQGRDGAPLTLAIPIVAVLVVGGPPKWRRFDAAVVAIAATLLVVAQIGAFAGALNRYVVGFDAPFDFFEHAAWQPPLGATTLLVVVTIAFAVGIGAFVISIAKERSRLAAI